MQRNLSSECSFNFYAIQLTCVQKMTGFFDLVLKHCIVSFQTRLRVKIQGTNKWQHDSDVKLTAVRKQACMYLAE